MSIDQFCWPSDLYDAEAGLTVASLQSVATRARLRQHAVEFGDWPGGLDGEIQFEALLSYCLRVGKPPGRLLTSAVRAKKFGRMAWFSAADKVAAASRIRSLNREQPRPAAKLATQVKTVARDWSEIDSEIEALTDDQAFDLLPNQFARDLFTRAAVNGKCPRAVPTLRAVLRNAIQADQRRLVHSTAHA